MSDPRSAARAIDALRRGWPVAVGALKLLAIETADSARLAAFDPDGQAYILLAGSRAATLKLANQLAAADSTAPVTVARTPWLDLPAARALADPATDLANPFQGPFRALPLVDPAAAQTALELARLAGILPAFFVATEGPADVTTTSADVAAYDSADRLAIVARARLPVEANDAAEIIAFRSPETISEHVALILGSPDGSPPLVRLHSECLTGDVLGSLKCDCGPQLRVALSEIVRSGWGILLYLRQEGRGIGLINKLRAYQLQDQGYDTVDANLRLGFAVDARDFGVAARMLTLLGQDKVRLLTNNPAKVAGLEAHGIAVIERVAHRLPANPHNEHYLATKRDRTGHQL
ncbi:GTP cyclohydrolase II [Sphingomonas sp. SUN039]|uniref:GTP cyclohydrolase II n=1 Tax=Sphingomonas sp. SUN039 TaxID=2937787 RepID=UPI0021647560|nr:GTP cyclohydrolase II [Sphingomonas sp. SUN039]UVO55196.1 GTP cyclohydrolase II [Sphingomonas sp. SUN039]